MEFETARMKLIIQRELDQPLQFLTNIIDWEMLGNKVLKEEHAGFAEFCLGSKL